jgi:hypothetical protein
MFPMLPLFATDTPTVRDALKELGKKGGIMDAADETDIAANPNLARANNWVRSAAASSPRCPSVCCKATRCRT